MILITSNTKQGTEVDVNSYTLVHEFTSDCKVYKGKNGKLYITVRDMMAWLYIAESNLVKGKKYWFSLLDDFLEKQVVTTLTVNNNRIHLESIGLLQPFKFKKVKS